MSNSQNYLTCKVAVITYGFIVCQGYYGEKLSYQRRFFFNGLKRYVGL